MEQKELIDTLEGALLEQQETLDAMNKQLEKVSNDLLGFKLAFIQLAGFLPLTERDVTRAREQAFAQAEDAMELDEMQHASKLAVFSTIRSVTDLAGVLWRDRPSGPA